MWEYGLFLVKKNREVQVLRICLFVNVKLVRDQILAYHIIMGTEDYVCLRLIMVMSLIMSGINYGYASEIFLVCFFGILWPSFRV